MSETTKQRRTRQHVRHQIDSNNGLKVVVFRGSPPHDGPREQMDAKSLDVSLSGMKLSTTQPLVFAERVELHFTSPDLKIDFEIGADVRWIRQGDDDEGWLVGLAFVNPISQDCVDSIATARGVDRRQWPRTETEVQATVQLASKPTPFSATMLNYSATGLRFATSEEVEPGQPIKLIIQDGDDDVFKVGVISRWVMSYESGYLVGCEVAGKHRGRFDQWRKAYMAGKRKRGRGRKLTVALGFVLIVTLAIRFWLNLLG